MVTWNFLCWSFSIWPLRSSGTTRCGPDGQPPSCVQLPWPRPYTSSELSAGLVLTLAKRKSCAAADGFDQRLHAPSSLPPSELAFLK